MSAEMKTFDVTVSSFETGSCHSRRILRETVRVTVEAGHYERADAFRAAVSEYRKLHPEAICPAVEEIEEAGQDEREDAKLVETESKAMKITHFYGHTYIVEWQGREYRAHYQPLAVRLECSFNVFVCVYRKDGVVQRRELDRRGPTHRKIRLAVRESEAFKAEAERARIVAEMRPHAKEVGA